MSPLRNDVETTSPATARCPVCHSAFLPVRRQRYCSAACRQAAWRSRQAPTATATATATTAATLGLGRQRRELTVYRCGECDQRYLGEQWCHDCSRPCTRDGLGGLCPCCEEPVTVQDLLDQHQPASIRTSKIR